MSECGHIRFLSHFIGQGAAASLVGDPVCVVTGAVIDVDIDFRLPQAGVPLTWWRSYNSSTATRVGQVGHGFHHSFDVALRFDLDGLRYTDPRGQSIGFPQPTRDGQSVVRQGYRLTRLRADVYRVTNAKEVGFRFEFSRQHPTVGQKVAWVHVDGRELALSCQGEHGHLSSIELDAIYRLDIHYDASAAIFRVAQVDLRERQSGKNHVLVAYTYDSLGRLSAVQDGYHHTLHYAYDASHRLINKTDRLGYSFRYDYDDVGRCVATRGQDGLEDLAIEYRPLEGLTVVRRADGAQRSYYYDAAGQIRQHVAPDGGAWVYPADELGRVCGQIDPLGNATHYRRNTYGAIERFVDPLGYCRAYPNDAAPHPLSHREALTPLQWDLGDRFARPTLRLTANDIVATWSPEINVALFFGPEVSGQPRSFRDFQGLLIRQDDAKGRHRRYGYDANGNPRWQQDFDGQTTRFDHGSWNHLEHQTCPLKLTTHFAYGKNDQIVALTDPGGTRSEYAYDLCDRLAEVRRHDRVRERYTYDAAGNLTLVVDGAGKWQVRREFASKNLLKRRVLASGESYDYEHDTRGRLVAMRGPVGQHRLAYAEQGLRCADLREDLGVEHDFVGKVLRRSVVLGRFVVAYEWHDASTLQVRDPSGKVMMMHRRGPGLIERQGSGVAELTQYDLDGRCLLRAAYDENRQTKPWVRRFHYSGEGDLLMRQDNQLRSMRYALDNAHRLVGQQGPDGAKERFVYDAADNLVQAPGLVARFGPGNRLLQANDHHFEHNLRDHIGRMHGAEGTTVYSYDAKDRLIALNRPGLTYQATFDGLGRRTHKTVNGHVTAFYWDGDRLAAEILPDKRVRVYIYADHFSRAALAFVDYPSIDAPLEEGRSYLVLTNHLSCPERVIDSEGQVVWQAEIAAYGWADVAIGAAFHQPLRWPGHYFDGETGLHDNRFRTYDPRLGRYLQSDPIGLAGGLNLYAYSSNPLRDVDLRGQTKHTCPDNVVDCPHRHEDGGDGEGGPPVHPRPGDDAPPLMSHEEANARAQEAANNHRTFVDGEIAAGRIAEEDAPACVAAVVDRRSGEVFVGHNQPKGVVADPDDFHPLLADRVRDQQAAVASGNGHPSEPGTHAEVLALDQALKARQATQPDVPLTPADMGEFTQLPMWYQGRPNSPHMQPGLPAPCCGNCAPITRGVNNLSGDATPFVRDSDGKWRRQH